jgi:hypothetical protein
VQKVKKVLKKVVYDNTSDVKLNEEIETFLRNYRNMPNTEEQIIPAHVVFSFKPRTALSIFDQGSQPKLFCPNRTILGHLFEF